MARSKIIYGGETLIDLTADTVSKDTLLQGVTAHGKDGEIITGECTYDSDTSEDTAAEAEILSGKTAHARGAKLTGKMTNNGAVTIKIANKNDSIQIPQGYHDGAGAAALDDNEKAKLIPANIRAGVAVLGVEGEMSGSEDVKAQSKSVTPTTKAQTVLPDDGYNYLSQVTVAAIPYVESQNAAGGITVTIG